MKDDAKMIILGQNIREIRTNLNLTQDEFSEKLDITPNHLSKIENGNVGVTVDTIINICKITNCSPISLFKGLVQFSNIHDKFELLDARDKDVIEKLISYLLNK